MSSRPQEWHDAPHWVYRCYDATGRLIYVGCTRDLANRLNYHHQTIWWAPQVEKVVAKVYSGRAAGHKVEREAIRSENPRWNVVHRWAVRRGFSRQDYADYAYAAMHVESRLHASRTVEHYGIKRIFEAFENQFGEPLQVPRLHVIQGAKRAA